MDTKIKKILSIMMAFTLLFGLSACGQNNNITNSSSDTDSTVSEIKKSKITIAIEATGDIPAEFQKQIERFNEASETAEASIITYTGAEAYETAIMGQIAGETAPDIILLDGGGQIKEYAQQGVIAPLDEYLGDMTDNFEQSLLEGFKVDGILYGITKDYSTSVLFCQTNMLEDAGVAVPGTIDEFKEAAQILTAGEVAGFGCDPKINYLYPFMATMGADFIGEDGTIDKDKLNNDAHTQALTLFKTLFENNYATSPYLANAGWDGELFGNQKVAMLYGGSWITGVIEDTSTAKAAPLPVENGSYSMLYTAGWAITEQCKDKQAAAELIQFLSSDEELILGYSAGLINLPPTTTAMDKLIEEQSDDSFLPVYREVVKDGVDYGLLDSEFTDAYNKALENMLYNNVSVEDTLAAIVSGQ